MFDTSLSKLIITSSATKWQFSIPQIDYPLGGSCKKGSHVYFMFQVFWLIILFWSNCTIVWYKSDVTIVVPWQLSTGSKHDYLFTTTP